MFLSTRRLAVVLMLGVACAPPPAPAPVSLLSFNTAQGAGPTYRTASHRAAQRRWLEQSGAQIIGLQEVDFFVARSGQIDVAAELTPFECDFAEWRADGTRRCAGAAGTVVSARALCAADPYRNDDQGLPAGIPDENRVFDRSPTACYGLSLIVRGLAVSETWAVGLPNDASWPVTAPFDRGLVAASLDEPTLGALSEHNEAIRRGPALEPRVLLVAHLTRPAGPELAVMVVHLEYEGGPPLALHQLQRVRTLMALERSVGRQVVVFGDFNLSAPDVSSVLFGHLTPAVESTNVVDQIWLDASLSIDSAEVRSTEQLSDHGFAPYALVY